ncbi:MAG: CvpA family protein [Clostridia bacterium]|nr:CvpA family protein [Clostridia bacterium]MCL6521528.1 CvpA family protein [Bacillota bacterium]
MTAGGLVDLVVLLFLVLQAASGLQAGFLLAASGLAGRLLGLYLAWRLAPVLAGGGAGQSAAARLAAWLESQLGGLVAAQAGQAARFLVWIFAFALVLVVVELVVEVVGRLLHGTVGRLPGFSLLDRVGGAALQLAGAAVMVAVLADLALQAAGPLHLAGLSAALRHSQVVQVLAPLGHSLLSLGPQQALDAFRLLP